MAKIQQFKPQFIIGSKIYPGLALVCPGLQPPMAISMEWTGPDGTAIMPAPRPEMISFTLYSSSNILDSIELADSGQYTCTVKIENEPEMSTSTNIAIGNNNSYY